MWTTDVYLGGMDGDLYIRLAGDVCQTGWRGLDDTWIDNFERGDGDSFTFKDVDIGSKVS